MSKHNLHICTDLDRNLENGSRGEVSAYNTPQAGCRLVRLLGCAESKKCAVMSVVFGDACGRVYCQVWLIMWLFLKLVTSALQHACMSFYDNSFLDSAR